MLKKLIVYKNFIIYGLGQIINLIVPILVAPIIIEICGIENFGKIGVATSVFLIISIFIDFGSSIIGVKEISIYKENKKAIGDLLNTVFTLKIIIFFILLLIIIILLIMFKNQIDFKLYFYSIAIVIPQVFNPLWIYQGKEDFKTSNIIIFFSKSIYVFLIYIFVSNKEDYIYILPLLGIANTITYLYFFLKIYKQYNLTLFKMFHSSIRTEFLKMYPILLSNICISIYTNAPILIVKTLIGDYAAGIFKMGDMLLMIFRSYLSVFFNVSFPKFCSLYTKSEIEGNNYLKKINIFNIIMILVLPTILFALSYFYMYLIPINDTIKPTILFCSKFLFIPIFIALNIPFYQSLIFMNEQKKLSKIIFISTIIMIVTCVLLTQRFNIIGTLLSIYFSEIFTTYLIIITYIRIKKNDKQHL